MIYVTGDTHAGNDAAKLGTEPLLKNQALSKDDYVIVAGDFGFARDVKMDDENWQDWFRRKNYTTLFVDGNNEDFGFLNNHPVDFWHGGKVHVINESVIHLMRGQVFDLDGTKIFTFGGAKSKGIERKIDLGIWWKEEMPSEVEFLEGIKTLDDHSWNVDYIVSHSCPQAALGEIQTHCGIKGKANELHIFLDQVHQKANYKHWYFGHYHADIELSERMTLLFNRVELLKE